MGTPQMPIKSDPKPTLDEALKDAHKKAAAAGSAGEWHRATIYVRGDNPIRDYIVTLGVESP
jgi:hypothetical protein